MPHQSPRAADNRRIEAQQTWPILLLGLFIMLMITAKAQASPDRWISEGWETDFAKTKVAYSEILSGGPPKDGIPSIDNPIFEPANAISTLGDQEPVIRVALNGEIRAYPLRILTWHEIVNDVIGGVPVAVTYCPLCNSAIVFDRRLGDDVLAFGTTGKLRNSDLVMYDRTTESWWQQFTGEAIMGSYVGTDLMMIPSRVESFARFAAENPDADVLVPNNPRMRRYGQNPYVNYDSRAAPYPLFTGTMPEDIGPMVRVVVVKDGDTPKAVTLAHLRLQEKLRLGNVELSWVAGQNSALDAQNIAEGRDVGNVMARKIRADGTLGAEVVHDITFAFAFHAFHPESPIVQN